MVASKEFLGNLALRGSVRGLQSVHTFLAAVHTVCWGSSYDHHWSMTWRTLDQDLQRVDEDGWPDPPEQAVLAELLLYARAVRLVVKELPDLPDLSARPAWLLVVLEDDDGARRALVDALTERWPFRQPMGHRLAIVEARRSEEALRAVSSAHEAGAPAQRVVLLAEQRLEPEACRGSDVLRDASIHGVLPDRWLMSARATAFEVGHAFESGSCSAFLPMTRSFAWMADRIWRCRMRGPVTSALQLVADLHPDHEVGLRLARCADLLLRLTPEELLAAPSSDQQQIGQAIFRTIQAARGQALRALPDGPLPVEIAR